MRKVTFGTELQNNKLYLAIEKVRFGSKLLPVFKVDEKCFGASLPNMILQPIYENAIKYGVYEATEPVEIITTASCNGGHLEISVENAYDPDIINKKGEGYRIAQHTGKASDYLWWFSNPETQR
jgi:two-component system, LytTR family, sensor kinase